MTATYTIYHADDGQYHARNNDTGFDLCDGCHQPVRRVFRAHLSDYLSYLGIQHVHA